MKINASALDKNESTPSMRVAFFGKVGIAYVGDLDGETLSMECAVDSADFDDDTATWMPCYPAEDSSVQETYSNSAASVRPRVFMLPGGFRVRWTMSNGAGTPVGVYVHADGENLSVG